MRAVLYPMLLGAIALAPASALAWWPFQPSLPEEAAIAIAYENGFAVIEDVDPTIDADWRVEGTDAWGNEVKIIIDGRTGAIERGEMKAR